MGEPIDPADEPTEEPAYRTDCGPLVGPARRGDVPSAIGVHDPDIKGWTLVGMAGSPGYAPTSPPSGRWLAY